MPAKITQSLTDNSSGQISVLDLQKRINDFIQKVELNCADSSRNPLKKSYYFDINLSRIQAVINDSPGADTTKIRINFSLNPPQQMDCTNTSSIENFLSIVICAIGNNNSSLLRVGDSILIEGFSDFKPLETFNPDCCVQGQPR